MKKIKLILQFMLSLPKTLYFNFKVFPIKIARKLPIAISYNVQIKEIYKNCIKIESNEITCFMIKIGFGGTEAIRENRGIIYLNKERKGHLIFKGNAKFSAGVTLYNNTGVTYFGNNFISNKNLFISCDTKIVFGENCLLGWNINIRDSDGHKILPLKESSKEIRVGNHVLICANVNILKGNVIGYDCVIAYISCVTGIECDSNKLIGGYPAKILKSGINWEK